MQSSFVLSVVAVAAAFSLTSAEAAPLYKLTDLGQGTLPESINAKGEIAADGRIGTPTAPGVYAWTPMSAPAGQGEVGAAQVNAGGKIAGNLYMTDGPLTQAGAGVWSAQGQLTELAAPLTGSRPFVSGINSSGTVAVTSVDAGNSFGPVFKWKAGKYTQIPAPTGARELFLAAIDDQGRLAATATDASAAHNYIELYTDGAWAQVADVGGRIPQVAGMDGQGRIAGSLSKAAKGENLLSTAFFYDGQTLAGLPEPGGSATYGATGINASDTIVGWSQSGELLRAVVWIGGTVYDLLDVTQDAAGWELQQAVAVDDAGAIVGTGYFDGEQHGFLLTPVAQ